VIAMADETGTVIAERYRLIELLGQGGMGRVWRGHDESLDRDVAIKQVLFSPDLTPSMREMLIARARREARATARLHHPNIVTVHDVLEHQGAPWIVMEYLSGISLGTLIRREGRQDWRRAAEIAAQVCDGLAHAHAMGVFHRDLKPDNILLTETRSVITDFGIARILDTTRLTSTNTLVGTPQYMSPEQLEGHELTPASDLWAVGATLYATVEGHPPFDGQTMASVIAAVLTRPVPAPEHAGPLAELLAALLAKDYRQRPDVATTARHLHDIANQTADTAASTRPAGRLHRHKRTIALRPTPPGDQGVSRPRLSRRTLIVGGLGLATAAIGGTAAALLLNNGDSTVLNGSGGAVHTVAFSPDGKTLASAGADPDIVLWNITTHAQQGALPYGGVVDSLVFSPDGKTLASGSIGVKLWDLATRTTVATIKTNFAVLSLAYSPNGAILAGGDELTLWNAGNHTVIASTTSGSDPVAFSPDGRILASSGGGNTVQLWDLTNLADLTSESLIPASDGGPETQSDFTMSIAFSPDGRTLARGGDDNNITLWDVASRSTITVLTGHTDAVLSLAYSPDGRTLASGGRDRTVRLWDTAKHTQTAVLTAHSQYVESVAFSPDGAMLASGSGDGTVRLWPIQRAAGTSTLPTSPH
jgi:serine/threonine protein kinase